MWQYSTSIFCAEVVQDRSWGLPLGNKNRRERTTHSLVIDH